jgi:hypothetical protein
MHGDPSRRGRDGSPRRCDYFILAAAALAFVACWAVTSCCFLLLAASALDCFCVAFFCVDFGDLSPMGEFLSIGLSHLRNVRFSANVTHYLRGSRFCKQPSSLWLRRGRKSAFERSLKPTGGRPARNDTYYVSFPPGNRRNPSRGRTRVVLARIFHARHVCHEGSPPSAHSGWRWSEGNAG